MPDFADLDAILTDLNATLPAGESVTMVSGAENCLGLFEDGEIIITADSAGEALQVMGTAIYFREGAITRPAVGASVTIQRTGQDDETFIVREVRRDGQTAGCLRAELARS